MPYRDSVDKIFQTYFAGITREPFVYKGTIYDPKDVTVSPKIFRGYTCPPVCGGCCPRFSLDYLPFEQMPEGVSPRRVLVNGSEYEVFSDMQKESKDHFCGRLDKQTGRCTIHGKHPFSCDFELIRFMHSESSVTIIQKLFGRGWNMLRVDGDRGALCEMIPLTESWKHDLIRRLRRLKAWAEYFELVTCMDEIIEWCESGPHEEALRLPAP